MAYAPEGVTGAACEIYVYNFAINLRVTESTTSYIKSALDTAASNLGSFLHISHCFLLILYSNMNR
jgi:hypothetical protein